MHAATAEASGHGYSLNINFPITILTIISLQQTGSVVITSEKQLFTYMSMAACAPSYFQ
jgi:hypothetical protein